MQNASIETNENVSSSIKIQPRNLSYEKLLLEAIDEVFSLFGDLVQEAVYHHLSEAFGISKQDIPCKVEQFVSATEETFGLGAKILQIQILKNLRKKVGPDFKYQTENADLKLTDYLETLRQFLTLTESTNLFSLTGEIEN